MENTVEVIIENALWVAKFLCPEPISPLFQENGPFYGLNEDIGFSLFFLLLVFLLDILIVKRFLTEKSRYFALHTFINTIVSIAAWPEVVRVFTEDPRYLFIGPVGTMVAKSAVVALHLYHLLAFKLTSADIFHHVTFVCVLCGSAIPTKHLIGVSVNLSCFFLSGLPGGIDYLMLVLMYEGKIAKATEKKWFAIINVYMRGPAMVIYAFTWWTGYYAGVTHPPQVVWYVIVLLNFFNGQYYSKQAVESAAVFFYREGLRKKEIEAASSSPSDGSPTTATAKGAVRAKQD